MMGKILNRLPSRTDLGIGVVDKQGVRHLLRRTPIVRSGGICSAIRIKDSVEKRGT